MTKHNSKVTGGSIKPRGAGKIDPKNHAPTASMNKILQLGRRLGAESERERIIKLLEEYNVCDHCSIISLIKGENK